MHPAMTVAITSNPHRVRHEPPAPGELVALFVVLAVMLAVVGGMMAHAARSR